MKLTRALFLIGVLRDSYVALGTRQLIADAYAKNGFKTYMPDLFKGDPVPSDIGEPGVSTNCHTIYYFDYYRHLHRSCHRVTIYFRRLNLSQWEPQHAGCMGP